MKKIILVMLISMFILTTSITVFGANSLTEINEEYPNVDIPINSNSDEYPYYFLWTINGTKYVTVLSDDVICSFDKYTSNSGIISNLNFYNSENSVSIKHYWLSGDEWICSYNNTFAKNEIFYCHDYGIALVPEDVEYCNFNIKDANGKIFFVKARYQPIAIIGQISSKTIMELTLMEVKILVVFLMVFLISVVAFRKGWGMLRTILSGA